MNKQEKAEPDFSFVLDAVKELQSSNAYWRKRCEAAEAVIASYNSDDSVYKYHELVGEWEKLKGAAHK